MFYYKVIHKYKLIDHIENKNIGIYSFLENYGINLEEEDGTDEY